MKNVNEVNVVNAELPVDEAKLAKIDKCKKEVKKAISQYNLSQKHIVKCLINLRTLVTEDELKLFVSGLDISTSTMSKIRTIINNETIVKHIDALPNAFTTLYIIASKLEEETIPFWMTKGHLTPKTTRKDMEKILNGESITKTKTSKTVKEANVSTSSLDVFFNEDVFSVLEPKTKDIEELASHFTDEVMTKFCDDLERITGCSVDVQSLQITLKAKEKVESSVDTQEETK